MLRDRVEASLAEHVTEDLLAVGIEALGLSCGGRPGQALASLAVGFGGAQDLPVPIRPLPLLGDQVGVSVDLRLAGGSPLDTSLVQAQDDGPWGNAMSDGQAFGALAPHVCIDDVPHGQVKESLRWDAPASAFTVQHRGAHARVGLDLLDRIAGQIALDRVVQSRRFGWSGYVFNVSSCEGWYSADGIVVSNCDCVHVPAREDSADDIRTDPKAFFGSLNAAEQDRVFTKAGAEAIRSGADIAQVVNARRGMQTATIGGQRVLVTTEGTRRSARRVRLMPEQILKVSGGDRAEAIRLLKLHRYLIP
jgi:hypothetical protein